MKKKFAPIAFNLKRTLTAKLFLLSLSFCCWSFASHATAWTTGTAGDVSLLSNWTDGTTSPTSFTSPGDTWTINKAMTLAGNWTVGTAATTAVTVTFATGGSIALTSTTLPIIDIYGDCIVNSGGISGIAVLASTLTMNVYGDYSMTAGSINTTGGIATTVILHVYGDYSMSGASAMMASGIAATDTVYLSLPTASGTMMINNTSTGTWSGTNIIIEAGCTAQLSGNFSTSTGATTDGLIVNGTLICPAAYIINGAGICNVNAVATLEVANASGINGAITTSGPATFNDSANYVFNGSVAQVTGSYLPVSLATTDTLTISNSAGVTLTQSTSTDGTLLFFGGILHTGANTMTTSGAATAVVGAGATSYVDGTLIKSISSFNSVNYEVGDVDYAPMNLAFSATGVSGSIAIMSTGGLHPNIGTSGIYATTVVNHYWTITDYSSSGPVTVIPQATYNAGDIIGGSNATFVTQAFTGAWLGAPLATTNTSSPYTSTPNAGIPLASLSADYIFGSTCPTLPITGVTSACVGTTTTLSDATLGGTWSSSNTAVATVDPATGVVSGVSGGTVAISYTTTCSVIETITVGTLPITGSDTLCTGSTTVLTDATAGGTWSSGNTGIATVSTTGAVYGVSDGTVNIFYTFGTCPAVGVQVTAVTLTSITGTTTLCSGGSVTTLSEATAGGVWSSDNTVVATVSATGDVSGIIPGLANISYTMGACAISASVMVGTLPITGATSFCTGSLLALSDGSTGGTWSSDNTGIATVSSSGVVYGVSDGPANISYTFGSCPPVGAPITTVTLTAITGTTVVCTGSSTALSESATGGVWSSSNTGVATVSSGLGAVSGVSAGPANIIYTIGACSVSVPVTVNGPLGAITGSSAVCVGAPTTLVNSTTGGTWSSSNTAIATVTGTGDVYGVSPGTDTISYTVGGCMVSMSVTVNGPIPAITGTTTILCPSSTTTLTNTTGGGTWSSGSTSVATVSGTGVVYGVSAGTATISYVVGGCTVTAVVTVNTSISAITGTPTTFCIGATTTLADATAGGTWSSSSTSVATVVAATGVVSGVSAGSVTITYSAGGCSANIALTIEASGAGTITGSDSVCIGATITLADAVTGGAWSSSNTLKATVGPTTGVVTGVASGTVTISYTVTNSCGTSTATKSVYVRTPAQCPTGINAVAGTQLAELKVFPNPNTGTFTINMLSDNNEEAQVTVTNMVGEKVKEFTITTNKAVDIKLTPSAGIYLLSVSTAHGRYIAKVVVD